MSLHFLIDGYNVIKQSKALGNISDLRESRSALVGIIQTNRLAGSRNNRVTIVFDGRDNLYLKQSTCPIQIIFSKSESADMLIKRLVTDSDNPKQVVVVTNDKAIIFYTRSLGAKIMPVSEFLSEGQEQVKGRAARKIKTPHEELTKIDLSYQQQEKINQELRRIWV